jgi:hypothetical protein
VVRPEKAAHGFPSGEDALFRKGQGTPYMDRLPPGGQGNGVVQKQAPYGPSPFGFGNFKIIRFPARPFAGKRIPAYPPG